MFWRFCDWLASVYMWPGKKLRPWFLDIRVHEIDALAIIFCPFLLYLIPWIYYHKKIRSRSTWEWQALLDPYVPRVTTRMLRTRPKHKVNWKKDGF